jgi:hypothetical protein
MEHIVMVDPKDTYHHETKSIGDKIGNQMVQVLPEKPW